MSEPLRTTTTQNIFNAQLGGMSKIFGKPVNVRDFQNITLSLAVMRIGKAISMTVFILGSSEDTTTPPNFAAPSSVHNRWDEVACYDYDVPTPIIPGTLGIHLNSSKEFLVKNLLVNTSNLCWLCAFIQVNAEGILSLDSVSFNNK